MQTESFEQHHRDVDAPLTSGDHALAHAAEKVRVEAVEVELRLAVCGRAGASPRPRLRRHAAVDAGHRELALELLPAPQPDEVVAVRREEVEVVAEVEPLRLGWAFGPEPQAIVQVVVDMRASQVDQSVFT